MHIKQVGNFLICHFGDNEVQNTAEYWTPERLLEAQPAHVTAHVSPGHAVKTEIPSNADLSVLPYKTAGKLWFTESTGERYNGTAQFVGQDNILLTAAHCVFNRETNTFNSNFDFRRGYNNGSYAKRFDVNAVAIRTEYRDKIIKDSEAAYDYAFLITTSNSDVGNLAYRFELPSSATSFGYPSSHGGGKVMQTVHCPVNKRILQPYIIMQGNPMGEGCSGGGWTDKEHHVIGLNSTVAEYSGSGEEMILSPIFDEKFKLLYEFVQKEA